MTDPSTETVGSDSSGTLRITLVRSTIGRPADQGRTVRSLGIRKIRHTVERPDNPSIRGMIRHVSHLVHVEEVPET
ncbi:MAG: 50S ribosomal protein L30 [Chloroflexota bacterium]|nr:50S ribosomal protein L30 [Chloroflexota bacterium]